MASEWTKISSKLIKKYTCFGEERIKPCIIFIKSWSKERGINDAHNGYINSFGYVLLSIKFLQCIKPPILPIFRYSVWQKQFEIIQQSECKSNRMSISELLYWFFNLFGNDFDPHTSQISITCKGFGLKTYESTLTISGHPDQKFFILQDPLCKSNNVAKNVRIGQWHHMQSEFKRAASILCAYFSNSDAAEVTLRILRTGVNVVSFCDHGIDSEKKNSDDSDDREEKEENNLQKIDNETMDNLMAALDTLSDYSKSVSDNDGLDIPQIFGPKTTDDAECKYFVPLDCMSAKIICSICMEEIDQKDKVYSPDNDEWILKNACFENGSYGNIQTPDTLKIVHRKCFDLNRNDDALKPILTNTNDMDLDCEMSASPSLSSLSSLSSVVSSPSESSADDNS